MKLTITDTAILLPISIEFFEKHGFDYYQHGSITLEDACEKKGLDYQKIDAELTQWFQLNENNLGRNLMEFDIEHLIEYINRTYHYQEHEMLNRLESMIDALVREEKKDKRIQYLAVNIEREFRPLKEKLLKHFESEDRVFFPYIEKLLEAKNVKLNIPSYHISLIKNPIRVLEQEHKTALKLLEGIKELTHQYEELPNSGNHYNDLMIELKRFEGNIHMHLHIENNILFPKLLDIEEIMNQKIQEKYH